MDTLSVSDLYTDDLDLVLHTDDDSMFVFRMDLDKAEQLVKVYHDHGINIYNDCLRVVAEDLAFKGGYKLTF